MPCKDPHVRQAFDALTGPAGLDLIELLCRLTSNRSETLSPNTPASVAAHALGWIDDYGSLTPRGLKSGDSCREYFFWNQRDRKMHAWGQTSFLVSDTFLGKRVLEIGCGCATNIFHLQQIAEMAVGLDVELDYLDFASLLAEVAGVARPMTINSSAEELPFDAEAFDVTVCFGALQYMDIRRALKENARVLKPGGEALWTLSDLSGFMRIVRKRFRTSTWRELARDLRNVVGMLAYPWIGRALIRPRDPVYPTFRRMARWLDAAGFDLDSARSSVSGDEVSYVATRR